MAAKKSTTKVKPQAEGKKAAASEAPDTAPPETEAAGQQANEPIRSPKARKEKVKKTSALDAAARVLGEAGQPMNCKELIDRMASKKYWTSPGGKTPESTLYAAILREVKIKGDGARFRKAERGKFELTGR